MDASNNAFGQQPQIESHQAPPPRYSVIVPAYNSAATLADCLSALALQTVPPQTYEVIVVDDGSTDGTADLAKRFAAIVLSQTHAGPASARNLGARRARGEFLLFTDADCVPAPNWVEEIVRPLESDPSVAASKGVYTTRQTGLVPLFVQIESEEKYAKLRRHRQIDFVDTYSAAFRREAFWAGGGFDTSFPAASNEDTLLSFNLASQGRRLVFTDQAIVYHLHSESLGHYLRRKWRHGYWRIPVYRSHPGKMAGDSYTPRSTQVQMATALLALWLAPRPRQRWLLLATVGAFVAATTPIVRRAMPVSWAVAAAAPFLLFLRALALACGLALGFARLLGEWSLSAPARVRLRARQLSWTLPRRQRPPTTGRPPRRR